MLILFEDAIVMIHFLSTQTGYAILLLVDDKKINHSSKNGVHTYLHCFFFILYTGIQ